MKPKQPKRKLSKARRSLDRMLDTIAPYAPKPTVPPARTTQKWKVAENRIKPTSRPMNPRDVTI